jgi:hypothetical protein
MAIIHTSDKRKVEVEVGAARAGEEVRKVAAGPVPLVELKLAGESEMVWVNATHIVSIEESG